MTIQIEMTDAGWQLFIDHEKITKETGLIDCLREVIKQHNLEDDWEIIEK